MSDLSEELKPASEALYLVQIGKIAEFLSAFGTDIKDKKQLQIIAKTYRSALAGIPWDLLAQSVDNIILTWKSRVAPKPAFFLSEIRGELNNRQGAMFRFRRAYEKLEREPSEIPPPDPDKVKQIAAMHRKWVAKHSLNDKTQNKRVLAPTPSPQGEGC
jgi:hypothetical protein